LGYSIFAGTGSGAWIFLHLQHCVVGIEKRPNKSKCSSYIYIYKDTDTDTDTETDTDTDTDRSASLASGCRHRCSTRKPECKPNQTKSRSKAPENSEIPRGEPKWTHMCHMVRLQESVASATSPEHLLIWCIYGTYAMPSPSAAYPAQDQCSFSLSPPTIISY